jgi:hypothetical protein
MAYSDELLEQAYHLAHKDADPPKQASLRRAVATAYYALFHLLIEDAVANWNRPQDRAKLGRAFDHGRMKAASNEIIGRKSVALDPVLDQLKQVAGTFVELQQLRHSADYDNARGWSRVDVRQELDTVTQAFQTWIAIRQEDLAQDYLVSFLVKR